MISSLTCGHLWPKPLISNTDWHQFKPHQPWALARKYQTFQKIPENYGVLTKWGGKSANLTGNQRKKQQVTKMRNVFFLANRFSDKETGVQESMHSMLPPQIGRGGQVFFTKSRKGCVGWSRSRASKHLSLPWVESLASCLPLDVFDGIPANLQTYSLIKGASKNKKKTEMRTWLSPKTCGRQENMVDNLNCHDLFYVCLFALKKLIVLHHSQAFWNGIWNKWINHQQKVTYLTLTLDGLFGIFFGILYGH